MIAEIKSGYGGRLDALRTALGLSITEFAQKADVAGSSMSLILREMTKNPSIGVFVSLSKSVNANLNWMAFGEGDMFNESKPKKGHNESADGGAFGNQVVERLETRIEELKDQVDNLKYIVNLQRQMLEQANGAALSVGKFEGAISRPLSTPLSFEETMRQYRQTVMGQMPKSAFFLVHLVAKPVAPRSFV